jgi:hypothetical protein
MAALERNWAMVDATLEGLDEATLGRCPTDQCNSIAWILWHMNRVVDTFIHTRLRSMPQLWIKDGWHHKFGMAPEPGDRGVGWTAQQVGAWVPPSLQTQLGYNEAVKAAGRAYISSLSAADLEKRMVIPPLAEPRTVADAIGRMTWDNIAHGGQIAYLRGLYRGMGWLQDLKIVGTGLGPAT